MSASEEREAPGHPGVAARWSSSAKSGVGTALTAESRVWFTLGRGIVNEVYYPRIDMACIRDAGLLVTGPDGFFSEEKRDAKHTVASIESGVPAYRLINTCVDGRYRITKEIVTDPHRDVLLQRIRFEALIGRVEDYRVYLLLAPHLVNGGDHNSAWTGQYKGEPLLFARGGGRSLAVGASPALKQRSVGYVGQSDGWRALREHGELAECYTRADDGNVAIIAELDVRGDEGVLVALGFGTAPDEAAFRVRGSLQDGFLHAGQHYVASWRKRLAGIYDLKGGRRPSGDDLYRIDVSVLLTHAPVGYRGAMIASLSIPWGQSKGDDDMGGYHLVWPRDLVESAGGLLAAGLGDAALDVLNFLQATQEADGRWPQNMWLDGSPYWRGVQLDECAFPILLVDALQRANLTASAGTARYLEMVRRAVGFIVTNGPITAQDRWEEDAGFSPFTLAVTIAALLAAAELVERHDDIAGARYLRETADAMNDAIESWTFVEDTPLSRAAGARGYYVRIASVGTAGDIASGKVMIRNRHAEHMQHPSAAIVSPDALALVRFGLRAADDPRMVDTVKVIDHVLKVELPQGPAWYRYNEDGYGEHEDGSAFDGTGIGRPWPLLTGERAHYELAAGRIDEARRLLAVMERSANRGGLLPEQVWDADDIPAYLLKRGRPSGSAMPLVWAHSEHLKLLRSLADGAVFDMPPLTAQRYLQEKVRATHTLWRFDLPKVPLADGRDLRIETLEPTRVHWSIDEWKTVHDTDSRPSGFGTHVTDLSLAALSTIVGVRFTFFWPGSNRWEGRDFDVARAARSAPSVRN
jgi:glucoamylase